MGYVMPADYKTDQECRWIEQFVRELAPGIDSAECGKQPNGDYELWLRLHPASRAEKVLITRSEYDTVQAGDWKEKIKTALQELNA